MPESGACVADGAGTVGERGGVDNGTPGVATARDSVSAASIDGSAGFVAQDAIATAYGTFTINRNGGWYYRLNDDNAAWASAGQLAKLTTASSGSASNPGLIKLPPRRLIVAPAQTPAAT